MDPLTFFQIGESLRRHSAASVLDEVQVPTLVVAGDADNFTPLSLCRRMHERIRDSELAIIPGGSHAALIEYPDVINRTVLDFMHRHFA